MQRIEPIKFEPPTGGDSRPPFSIRKGPAVTVALLLFFAATAWFIFSAKAVYIATTPENATINIDGGLKLKLADRYLLRPDEYEINIDAEGYYPFEQRLTVSDDQNQYYSFQLQRLPGHLRIDSGPVSGAEIFIDNISRGRTPAVIRDIPYGEHQLRVSAERYFPYEETVLVEGLDHEQTIQPDLRPAWADVTFSTQPDGADIFLDDALLGQTPFTAEVLEGEHAVRIKLPGYKVWQDKIRVQAQEPMGLDGIKLEPADAVVFLVSSPPRANITVDGEYQGLTPLELALTPGKRTTIRLYKQGFRPASRQLTAKSGDRQRLKIDLEPELVDVEFNVMPADAKLYVDGKLRGPAQQTVRLSATAHRIEIRKQGYADYETTITPHSGMAQQVNVKLKTQRQVRMEKVKPVITTTAGQTLKLFYPTPFTMGASRREAGRRANETIRNITLTRPFYLGLHEVTNGQYRLFDKEHSSGHAQSSGLNGEDQPVVKITWEQAALYCNWLSRSESLPLFYKEKDNKIVGSNPTANGYRLPTEAEWAWAARVAGKDTVLKFPWGGELPPPPKSGNYADESSAHLIGRIINGYQDGFAVTAPVGSFQSNDKGLYDMGGNVAEWVHDFYDIAIGKAGKTEVDPRGPDRGEFHVIRGSSWAHGTVTELRLSYRDYGSKARDDLGFRIARNLE